MGKVQLSSSPTYLTMFVRHQGGPNPPGGSAC